MSRPPIGKRAMTPAERQRRRRKKLRKEKLALGARAESERRRLKHAKDFVPMPAGVTYWRAVKLRTADGGVVETFMPTTKPLLSIRGDLDDNDIIRLLQLLTTIAISRELLKPGEAVQITPSDHDTIASLMQVTNTRKPDPDECCTVGPVP